MQGGLPALQRRMPGIQSGLAGQLLTECAPFTDAVAGQQLTRHVALFRTFTQAIEPPPFAYQRSGPGRHDQRARRTAAQHPA